MEPPKSARLQANDVAIALGLKKAETTAKLEEIVDAAIRISSADRGFLIVSSRKDPYAVQIARNFDRAGVPEDQQVVSRELLKNAWDMGDSVVAGRPFDWLAGVKGTYELKGKTCEDAGNIRSALVAPLADGERMLGALVLHEQKRAAPFTIDDRRDLEPLAALATQALTDAAKKVRDEHATLIVPPVADPGAPRLVGEAEAFKAVLARVDRAARSEETVLIRGETGTGKEEVARRLHAMSRRAKGPFVVANMANMTGEIMDAELYGYVKGAFTGAAANKEGLVAAANGGTLFLDEIGELALEHQGRLLRFLQERTYRPVGGLREIPVDVRVVAATNRDLDTMAAQGTFKFDLLMRLETLPIETPPLRERRADIRPLVAYFMARIASQERATPKTLTEGALQRLERQPWPGNVRELKSVLHRAVVFSGDETSIIKEDQLEILRKDVVARSEVPRTSAEREAMKHYLLAVRALHETGSREAAFKQLAISRATLHRWVSGGRDFDPDGVALPEWYHKTAER